MTLVHIFNSIEDLRFDIKMDHVTNEQIEKQIRIIQDNIINLINNDQKLIRAKQWIRGAKI